MGQEMHKIVDNYHTHLGRDERAAEFTYRSFRRNIQHWLPKSRDAAILDAGCGEGVLLRFLRDQGFSNLSAFDLSAENVRICRESGFSFVQQHNALDIASFSPGSRWDLIVCRDLLEHFEKHKAMKFLEDVRGLLKPDGAAIFQTPNMAYICANVVLYGDPTHETGYSEASLRAMLSAAGFGKIEIGPHWYATSLPGHLREWLLRARHWWHYLPEGSIAPRIPTKNLLARARP